MLAFEHGNGVLSGHELIPIALELFFDELPRRIGVLALVAEASFHKQREQRLHYLLRDLGVLVDVGDGVQVFPAGTLDGNFLSQASDQSGPVVIGIQADVEVSHLDYLLQVRAADQGSAHHRHHLLDVGLHRKAR